ncbi:MAG TPA: isoamylase early set domain-containing protein [Gemmatimonadales bacterium]|nr:isoamylase early set domain-containing protein [Gemmatimonadales bacterium]
MTHDFDPRIHRALDGELDRTALTPEERTLVERLDAASRALSDFPAAPGGTLTHRVMGIIRRPLQSPVERFRRWLTSPHPVTLSLRPVYSVIVAVLLVALLWRAPETPLLAKHEGVAQFVARFPEAHSVAVVGPFNDWRPEATPLSDDDHDGVWDARVILPAGPHEYMFVVDGERWVADPMAGKYVDDGFGRQNAVMEVRPVRSE